MDTDQLRAQQRYAATKRSVRNDLLPWLDIADPIMQNPTKESLIAASWFLMQMQFKIIVTTKTDFEEEWNSKMEWVETLSHCINRTEELMAWLGEPRTGRPDNELEFLKATVYLKLRFLRMSLRSIRRRVLGDPE
jgi:hypothetical protein